MLLVIKEQWGTIFMKGENVSIFMEEIFLVLPIPKSGILTLKEKKSVLAFMKQKKFLISRKRKGNPTLSPASFNP